MTLSNNYMNMKSSDLLIDLNDIYGRLIPGMFLIIELYLIKNLFTPISPEKILGYLKDYASLSIFFILIFLIVSHIIGELPLSIFAFRRILFRKTPIENLKELDVTKEKDLIKFFESNFSEDSLNSKNDLIMSYCKDYLLENSFQAYTQAKKIEARINLKGGMVIPMIILIVISLLYRQWALTLLPLSLSVLFFVGFVKSFESEDKFIYKAYYNCWTNLHSLDNQSKNHVNPDM